MSSEERLKRFLYLSTENPYYVSGDPFIHNCYAADKLSAVYELLQTPKIDTFCKIIEEVNEKNVLAKRETLFCALAAALSISTLHSVKHKIYCTLGKVVRSNEDLYCFIMFYTLRKKKFGGALSKIISNYYTNKDPYELAVELSKNNGYHSWTHKDVLKLIHIKTDNVYTTIVLYYILFGLKRAVTIAEGKPEAEKVIQHLSKTDELKRCEDEKRIVELIGELKCNFQRVPSFYHKSLSIWEAITPHMPLSDLVACLPRLYKMEFLKNNTVLQKKIMDLLTNNEAVQASNIHPVEVLIGLKNFMKGGKPIHPALLEHMKGKQETEEENKSTEGNAEVKIDRDTKCPNIVSALHRMMQISFKNSSPHGKSMLLSIECSDKMERACLNNKNVTSLEGAVISALSFLRVENEVYIATFNDSRITQVNWEKNITFNTAISKLKQGKQGKSPISLVSPFDWATQKKKHIKVFIHFVNRHKFHQVQELPRKDKIIEGFRKYKTKMSAPNSKLILVSLSSHKGEVVVEPNVLTICGFTKEVPKVMDAFIRDLYS